MMTMDRTRAQAYGRVVKTLQDLGPAKLLPAEQETIRQAADAALFDEDVEAAVGDVQALADRLVEADRWTSERAGELVRDVAACGPATVLR